MAKATAAFLFGLALLASAPGCAPPVPANPTYATDIHPIFMARCVRCHDETLRGDTIAGAFQGMPVYCHLNRFESTGNCAEPIDFKMCSLGAGLCASLLEIGAQAIGSNPPMPLFPAPKLDSWEQDVLGAWLKNVDANGLPAP